jgi:hypothetical protein
MRGPGDPLICSVLTWATSLPPPLIAEAFGVETDRVAAYLKHPDVDEPPAGSAADGDEHDLADTWVFTDFWRALGVETRATSTIPRPGCGSPPAGRACFRSDRFPDAPRSAQNRSSTP